MSENSQPRGVICFTNPEQIAYIRQNGPYGNVGVGDKPSKQSPQAISAARRIRFGKLNDLLCVKPGDLVFLFETVTSKLHGVWKVADEPFYSTTDIFDPKDIYPYRLLIERFLEFSNPVPSMELRKLLDKGTLWTIRTFEREMQAAFASINPISVAEAKALLDLFWIYNHRLPPSTNPASYNHKSLNGAINFYDLVIDNIYASNANSELKADTLGKYTQGQILEEALHCFIVYNLARGSSQMRDIFGSYSQVLREVPVSTAGQQRVDFLIVYENPSTGEPSVYSLMEVKRDVVTGAMLRQLLEYLKLFSERHEVDTNAIEGVYVGKSFTPEAIDYAEKRATIEVERPIRLIGYEITGNTVTFNQVSSN